MNWQNFKLENYLLTENERLVIEAEIVKQYETALELINDKIGVLLTKARDAGIDPADQYNWLIQYNRLENLRTDILDAWKKAGGKITQLQIEAFDLSFSNQYYRASYALDWAEPLTFTALDTNLVRYAMTGELEAWKAIKQAIGDADLYVPVAGTLKALINDNLDKAVAEIWRQINAGLINGEGISEIAKRIELIIGKEYGGQVTGEIYKALRIAHTEGHRAQNMAEIARAKIAESQGMQLEKMWDATLDIHTRGAHASLDGDRVPLDGTWNMEGYEVSFPGDPSLPPHLTINCRCQSITVTPTYEPKVRRGRDPVTGQNEVFEYKTYKQWAEEKGLKLNKYGKYTLDK